MKKSIFKTFNFWFLFTALIISLFIIFATPYIWDSFKDLNYRLLLAFGIFFGSVIIILLIILFKKDETKEVIEEKKEELKQKKEYEKKIKEKTKDLKKKFYEAIKIIKKSSLYKNTRKAKYELPWYLVIGNNSEGKTTLLESSGLNFPLNVDYTHQELVEERDTESFQWYFAEHSIFIDMPGNYIEQRKNPEDPTIWKEFLKIFTKKRWRRPINGVILTVSVETLQNKSEKELEQYAKDLRDRFDELSKAFMSSIPIYLIITKSDQIEGFNEYFATLTEDEKNEILGITFDSSKDNIDTEVIKPHLEDLIKRLNSSVMDKMHYEWEQENKSKIYLFCENFSELFEKTNLFIEMCFSQTRYRKPLLLRGIYFTSVPGQFNPHALIQQDQLEYSKYNSRGLFIKKLLNDIIFPESDIIKMDNQYKKKIKRNQYLAYGVSLLIVFAFSFFLVTDFVAHNDLLTKIDKNYQKYLKEKKQMLPNTGFEEVLPILNRIEKIKIYNKNKTTDDFWKLLFFKTEERNKMLLQQYHTDLVKLFLPRVANMMSRNIKRELKHFDRTWDNTKAYIMLDKIARRDINFLTEYMSKYWNEKYPKNTQLQNQLIHHWNNLLQLGFNSYSINQKTLKLARNRLTQFGPEQLTYKGIQNKVSKMNLNEFSFTKVLANDVSAFHGHDYKIPGFYTKQGYSIMMKEGRNLTSHILQNNWVIGARTDLNPIEIDKYYNKILSFYFNDYKNYWNRALSKLRISTYRSITSLNAQLSSLSSSQSPVVMILEALKEHTDLYAPSEKIKLDSDVEVTKAVVNRAVSGQIARAVTKKAMKSVDLNKMVDNSSIKNLRSFFKPYNSLLDKDSQPTSILISANSKINHTYQLMTAYQGAITPNKDAFKIVTNRIQGKSKPIVAPMTNLPIYVKKWYRLVLLSNWNHLLGKAKSYLNKRYQEDVYTFYRQRLINKYPISKLQQANLVKLDDFADFFKSDGILDRFYKQYLSHFVKINPNTYAYEYNNLDGSRLNIDKNILNTFAKSFKIRRYFFKNDGSLGFSAYIKPYDLSSNLATMHLMYDNKSIYYEHGPILNKKIVWPPKSQSNVTKFKLITLDGSVIVDKYIDNDWAFFQLIDLFKINKSRGNDAIIKYVNGDCNGSFNIKGDITRVFTRNSSLSNFYLSENL